MESKSTPSSEPKNAEEQRINEILTTDPWEEVGVHRNIGSFWYNFSLAILTVILSVFFLAVLVQILFPYPEMQGYVKVAGNFFLIIYQIFDIGTAFGIEMFISKYRISDPKRMLKYVQWFIWYQMFTGLVQVLGISIIVFRITIYGDLSYLTWIFLIICQKQWPGMLGTFKNVVIGLQKYDKGNILNFLAGEVTRNIFTVVFVLVGRWWGTQNPQYGDLFGATIGLAIGSYFIDFVVMILGAHYFNQAMHPFGFTFRDCWRIEFDWPIAKECLWFGLQTSIVPIVNVATGTWMLLMYINTLPQYTTWVFIAEIAGGIGGVINVGDFGLTPAVSESFMNGKKELTNFYIQTSLKWNGFFMMFLLCVIGGFAPMILANLTLIPDLANYAPAVGFIPFFLIQAMFRPFVDIPNTILVGTLHIGYYTFVRVLEEFLQVFFVWLFLYGFKLQITLGIVGIYIIFGWEHFFPRLIKMMLCFFYINHNIFKVKIYWMPAFIIPLLSSLPVLGIASLWQLFIFDLLIQFLGIYVAAVITLILAILVLPFLIFLPLTGVLGGWDDYQLKIFAKSVALSGPSKPIIRLFYRMVVFWSNKSPFHNRWSIPWDVATRQIHELHLLKAKQDFLKPTKAVQGIEFVKWIKNRGKNIEK